MNSEEIIHYLRKHYPHENTQELSDSMGIPYWKVRKLATKHGLRKSDDYLKELHKCLMASKKEKYLESIPDIKLTEIEQNIIVGSILGDGGIDPGPKRAINSHYKERFGEKQREYRQWKASNLERLGFKILACNQLNSPSHPIYTKLYKQFYPKGKKTITQDNIKLLTHPIGLACLYMDDGSLVIGHTKRDANTLYISYAVSIYSQSFTKEENKILINHLKETFGVTFRLKSLPSGTGYCLTTGKSKEINNFLKIVYPFVSQIPSMLYKADLALRIANYTEELQDRYGKEITITTVNPDAPSRNYSKDEVNKIINLLGQGISITEIAKKLNRFYFGVYDKIKRLKIKD